MTGVPDPGVRRRPRWWKVALAVGIGAVVLLVAAEVITRTLVATVIADRAKEQSGAETATASVQGSALAGVLSGRFSSIEVDLEGIRRNGLRVAGVSARMEGVRRDGSGADGGTATVELTEADVDAYLAATPVAGIVDVAFDGGIKGTVPLPFGRRATLTLDLVQDPSGRLVLDPVAVSSGPAGFRLPAALPGIALTALPDGAELVESSADGGRLVATIRFPAFSTTELSKIGR